MIIIYYPPIYSLVFFLEVFIKSQQHWVKSTNVWYLLQAAEFITAHRKDFSYLFFRGFPYSCSQRHEEGNKSRKEMRSLECVNQDPRCLFQNLAICSIFYCFCSDHNLDDELSSRMLKYIKGKIRHHILCDLNALCLLVLSLNYLIYFIEV